MGAENIQSRRDPDWASGREMRVDEGLRREPMPKQEVLWMSNRSLERRRRRRLRLRWLFLSIARGGEIVD